MKHQTAAHSYVKLFTAHHISRPYLNAVGQNQVYIYKRDTVYAK
jgi:hypothetical protein